MSIALRCSKCNRYYALKHLQCPACGNVERSKQYHVRFDGKATYAGHSLKIAKEMESKIKSAKRLGKISDYAKPKEILFTEFITKYYDPHYSGKKSAHKMKFMVDYFTEAFKDKSLQSITPADIEVAVTSKTIHRSPRTRDHYLAIIRRIYNYAVELELIERSPVKMKELRVDNCRHRYLNNDEVVKLLDECAKSPSKHLLPMVLIALHTGMRLGEINSLKKADIVDGKFYLKSQNTKNSKVKIIPINDALQKYLEDYFKENEEFCFSGCRNSFNNAIKRAGIKDFRFHDLRHTFASKLKANNINDSVIQKLLGHSTPQMVQRYAHLSPESVLNAVKVVDYSVATL